MSLKHGRVKLVDEAVALHLAPQKSTAMEGRGEALEPIVGTPSDARDLLGRVPCDGRIGVSEILVRDCTDMESDIERPQSKHRCRLPDFSLMSRGDVLQ